MAGSKPRGRRDRERAALSPVEFECRSHSGDTVAMAVNWAGLWRVAQAAFGIADASRQFLGAAGRPASDAPDLGLARAPGGMLGQLEASLTGVMVSALKEAFNRDSARLDLERAALDEQRRRAEEALRLELVRQAADRAASRVRAIAILAVLIWAISVVFMMRFPDGLAGTGRIVLGTGWVALLGATAASIAAHTRVSRWVSTAHLNHASPDSVPEDGPAAIAAWLVLAGLALVGASLLIAI